MGRDPDPPDLRPRVVDGPLVLTRRVVAVFVVFTAGVSAGFPGGWQEHVGHKEARQNLVPPGPTRKNMSLATGPYFCGGHGMSSRVPRKHIHPLEPRPLAPPAATPYPRPPRPRRQTVADGRLSRVAKKGRRHKAHDLRRVVAPVEGPGLTLAGVPATSVVGQGLGNVPRPPLVAVAVVAPTPPSVRPSARPPTQDLHPVPGRPLLLVNTALARPVDDGGGPTAAFYHAARVHDRPAPRPAAETGP